MKHVYFIRHGESEWNRLDKICGAIDIPLTEKGVQQALETGRNILRENIQADMILCSPLQRAVETAKAIAAITGLPCRVEPRLTEQNFGIWEGTSPRNAEAFQQAKQQFAAGFHGGESMLRVAQRVYNLLDDIRNDPEDRTYILVSHNGIARVVRSYFEELGNEEFARYAVPNCTVTRFDFPEDAVPSAKEPVRDVRHVDPRAEEQVRTIATYAQAHPQGGYLLFFRGHATPCTFDSVMQAADDAGTPYTSVCFWDDDSGNLFDISYREVPEKLFCNGQMVYSFHEED